MIERLYELMTGKTYWTVRSMAVEFGPTPAVEFAGELGRLSEAELIEYGWVVVARLRAAKRVDRRVPVGVQR